MVISMRNIPSLALAALVTALLSFAVLTGCETPSAPANIDSSSNRITRFTPMVRGEHGPQVRALFEYLRQYGYFPNAGEDADGIPMPADPSVLDEALVEGVRRYQHRMSLPVTGMVDDTTVELLNRPRCSHTDRNFDERISGAVTSTGTPIYLVRTPRWPWSTLFYTFDNYSADTSPDVERGAVQAAMATWASVAPIRYAEGGPNPEVHIGWYVGDHGDGSPFAPGTWELAHGLYPTCLAGATSNAQCAALAGDLHFNDDFNWTWGDSNSNAKIIDIQSVALHELGHTLGLGHSSDPNAVMYAVLPPTGTKRGLNADDIAGIQSLYPTFIARCGDGFADAPEQCDDANGTNDDGCSNACTAARCGDGILQAGEQCDDANGTPNDGCTNVCTLPRCGDGIVQAGEQCDDANGTPNDGCTNVCTLPRCGDGIVQAGETCDDGNGVDNDGCRNSCRAAQCGDGVLQAGETCDDGNQNDNDSCSNQCRSASCGDGIVLVGIESCDDGNKDDHDSCTTLCTPARCGDGIVFNGVEECDDGNHDNTDGCTNTCVPARCGDGYRQGVEECDDGNGADGDGCSKACKVEAAPRPSSSAPDASSANATDAGPPPVALPADSSGDFSDGGCAVSAQRRGLEGGTASLGLAALGTIAAMFRRRKKTAPGAQNRLPSETA